jgi:hypothetical protein
MQKRITLHLSLILGIQIVLFSAPLFQQEIRFKADHPFLFLIKQNSTVLFMGRKIKA